MTATPVAFDRDDIVAALAELAELLAASDVSTTIRVVGGAALAVLHGRVATTTDIDALYGAPEAVAAAVATIAARRGWQPTWLNDRVKMFARTSTTPLNGSHSLPAVESTSGSLPRTFGAPGPGAARASVPALNRSFDDVDLASPP